MLCSSKWFCSFPLFLLVFVFIASAHAESDRVSEIDARACESNGVVDLRCVAGLVRRDPVYRGMSRPFAEIHANRAIRFVVAGCDTATVACGLIGLATSETGVGPVVAIMAGGAIQGMKVASFSRFRGRLEISEIARDGAERVVMIHGLRYPEAIKLSSVLALQTVTR